MRLTVARLPYQDDARAMFQNRCKIGSSLSIAEREEEDIELLRHFTQQIEDANRAAMRQGIWKIWTDNRDPSSARRQWPPRYFLNGGRLNRAVLFPGNQPFRTKEDAIDFHTPQKQPGVDVCSQAQVVPLQPLDVSQPLCGRQHT